MIAARDDDQHYAVEISGWNSAENFFVEKASLEWTTSGLKSVRLKADLHPGTIVFLRLLEYGPSPHQFPVAYQTTGLGPRELDGRAQICLEQLHARETRQPLIKQESSVQELVPVT
jgi:hypothetical protein